MINCERKFYYNNNNKCDSTLKYENLIKEIINKKYIYMVSPGDTSKFDYLISNLYIEPGKVFYVYENIPIYPIITEKIDTLNAGVILIDSIGFESNQTEVKLIVSYFSKGRVNTETKFNFILDSINCSWKTIDSSRKIF